jgi:iron complex outermembrane receptor protein
VWQAGGYFEMSKGIDPSGSQSPGNIHCDDVSALNCYDVLGFYFRRPTGLANWYVSTMDFLNVAAYGQSTYKFTDRLKGTVGVRYSRDRTTSDAEVANWRFVDASPPSLTPQELNTPELHCLNADSGHPFSQVVQSTSACAIHLSKTSSAPTWLVGLDYNLTQDMMVYGKYSRGYRHGVVVALRASSWGTHGTSGCRMSTSKGQCGHAHGGEALYRTISCALDSGG